MDVADELIDSDERIDRGYVESRLDDWRCRLNALYRSIAGWLPRSWTLADGGTASLNEEPMRRYGVPERSMPAKVLLRDGQPAGRLIPRGLWIIGANGRVDLILFDGHFIIVDRAQSFESPEWTIIPLRDRLHARPLTGDTLAASLE